MIRIGDFSKLSRVTVKTLRYYDEMGLLHPVEVDPYTGYRYYEYNQLPRLHRILALRDLGFHLEEIARFLDEGLSSQQIHGMLLLRQAEIRQAMHDEEERLQRVASLLHQIDLEDNMSEYAVVMKAVEPIRIASVRGVVRLPSEQGSLWEELGATLGRNHVKPVGPCFSLYHDKETKEFDWDIEVAEPISAELVEAGNVKVTQLPAVAQMACTVHHGPFQTLSQAYAAILKWVDENGYEVTGPCREVYLHEAVAGVQDDPNTITEIQFPVRKLN